MKTFQGLTFLLVLITCIAFFLRIYNLEHFPNGFSRDEAYLGYNAYSILKTGSDINGNFLPLFLESFLYTPAGYSYISIPFIKIFGLNEFAVRFASAFFGVLTIPLIFLFTRSLLSLKNSELDKKSILIVSFLSSILLTILPWHINLSRTASVSTVVTFLILLGTYFLLNFIKFQNTKFLVLGFFFYIISLGFYIAPYSFIPFLILIIFFSFQSSIQKFRFKFLLCFVFLLIPIVFTYAHKDFSLRVQSLSLTKNAIVPIMLTENANRDGVLQITPVVSRFFHNKLTVLSDLYTRNYFKHLSYEFLFSDQGFPDRYRIPEAGLIYPIFIIFLIAGMYALLQKDKKVFLILVGWILVSPVGSSFANDDVPNMQRTLFMLIPLVIFMSYGIYFMYSQKNIYKYLLLILAIIVFYQITFYWHQYIVHENSYRPWYRQEGYKDLIAKINELKDNYKKVIVTNRESAPTIFLGFYNAYDPKLLQSIIKTSRLKDTDRISFAEYEITEKECPVADELNKSTGNYEFQGNKEVLYVNSGFCKSEDLPKNTQVLNTIKRSDGSVVFYIVAVR